MVATKERRKLVGVGPRNPKKEMISVLLLIVESWSTMRTESLVPFWSLFQQINPIICLLCACTQPMNTAKKSHLIDSLSTTPDTSWKLDQFSLVSLLSQQPPCSFHTFPVVRTSHAFFPSSKSTALDWLLLIFPIT